MEAVILAAGRGERMRFLSNFVPKALIPIANRPVIEHLILAYKKAGILDFIIVTGHLGNQIRRQLGDGSRLGVSIRYKRSPNYKLGPIYSLLAAESELSTNDFFVSPADFIIDSKAIQLVKKRYKRSEITVAADINSRSKTGTTIYIQPADKNFGQVTGFRQPILKGGEPHLCVGLLICNTSIFQYVYKALENGSSILMDALNLLIQHGQLVCFVDISNNFWFDLDTVSDILQANEFMLKKGFIPKNNFYVKDLKQVVGPPKKKLNINLDKTATISGPAVFEPNCDIGSGSKLGPFISATSGCEIASEAVIHNSLLFGNAVVKENTHLSNVVLYKNLVLQSS